MIVNAAVFTCSICGEASANICAYCTKDVCSNHRCERCKRCSDCCECEVPLSAEEQVAAKAESPAAPAESSVPGLIAPEESSAFVEPFDEREPFDPSEPASEEPISQQPMSNDPPDPGA